MGPLERLGHSPIEVVDEGVHLVSQVVKGAAVTVTEELANQDAEPDLDLAHRRGVFGRVVEDD